MTVKITVWQNDLHTWVWFLGMHGAAFRNGDERDNWVGVAVAMLNSKASELLPPNGPDGQVVFGWMTQYTIDMPDRAFAVFMRVRDSYNHSHERAIIGDALFRCAYKRKDYHLSNATYELVVGYGDRRGRAEIVYRKAKALVEQWRKIVA